MEPKDLPRKGASLHAARPCAAVTHSRTICVQRIAAAAPRVACYHEEAMFRHEGAQRTFRHNQYLAGYLAMIAGIVNSAGFVLIGSFTSHVTGNVGRFADDLALGRPIAPLALVLVIAYYAGAVASSMALESGDAARPRIYSLLLFLEAVLLGAFALLSHLMNTQNSAYLDVQALLLCLAMGMQNSFVTRLSGAVVRTTHLTGVVTDLGIETARWFRYWRASITAHTGVRLIVGSASPERPSAPRALLLLTITGAFVVGSMIGAVTAVRLGVLALLVPAFALLLGSGAAVWTIVRPARLHAAGAQASLDARAVTASADSRHPAK